MDTINCAFLRHLLLHGINAKNAFFSANERSEGEGKGKEKGKGKSEAKLWQKQKKTPQLGIEPGTPANAADASSF